MLLSIIQPQRGLCRRCSPPLPTRGYVVEDAAKVRQFICIKHLGHLLNGCCQPEVTPGSLAAQTNAAADGRNPVEFLYPDGLLY